MKTNYFSRLARSSGLRFVAGAAAAIAPATGARESAPLPHSAAYIMPHSETITTPRVEEVTFVEPSHQNQDEFAGTRDEFMDLNPSSLENHSGLPLSIEENSVTSREPLHIRLAQASSIARHIEAHSREPRADMQPSPTNVGARHAGRFDGERTEIDEYEMRRLHSSHQPSSMSDQSHDSSGEMSRSIRLASPFDESPEPRVFGEEAAASLDFSDMLNVARHADASSQTDTSVAGNRTQAGSGAAVEARRAYLSEIAEWIATPTGMAANMSNLGRDDEGHTGTLTRKNDLSPASSATSARAEATRDLEVQDFSLSIGSISIVIEEPATQRFARAPERATPENVRPSAAPIETSRLRRHYVRGL